VKRAKPCECSHALALHDTDGAGPCTLCECSGPPLMEEPDAVAEAVAADVMFVPR